MRPETQALPNTRKPRDDEIAWTVLADPQGNEFCAFDQT